VEVFRLGLRLAKGDVQQGERLVLLHDWHEDPGRPHRASASRPPRLRCATTSRATRKRRLTDNGDGQGQQTGQRRGRRALTRAAEDSYTIHGADPRRAAVTNAPFICLWRPCYATDNPDVTVSALLLLLVGCAALPPGKRSPRDPWERMNRATYRFNDTFGQGDRPTGGARLPQGDAAFGADRREQLLR